MHVEDILLQRRDRDQVRALGRVAGVGILGRPEIQQVLELLVANQDLIDVAHRGRECKGALCTGAGSPVEDVVKVGEQAVHVGIEKDAGSACTLGSCAARYYRGISGQALTKALLAGDDAEQAIVGVVLQSGRRARLRLPRRKAGKREGITSPCGSPCRLESCIRIRPCRIESDIHKVYPVAVSIDPIVAGGQILPCAGRGITGDRRYDGILRLGHIDDRIHCRCSRDQNTARIVRRSPALLIGERQLILRYVLGQHTNNRGDSRLRLDCRNEQRQILVRTVHRKAHDRELILRCVLHDRRITGLVEADLGILLRCQLGIQSRVVDDIQIEIHKVGIPIRIGRFVVLKLGTCRLCITAHLLYGAAILICLPPQLIIRQARHEIIRTQAGLIYSLRILIQRLRGIQQPTHNMPPTRGNIPALLLELPCIVDNGNTCSFHELRQHRRLAIQIIRSIWPVAIRIKVLDVIGLTYHSDPVAALRIMRRVQHDATAAGIEQVIYVAHTS